MEKDVYSDETLRQYLLGEVSDHEGERIERQYLADKDSFDHLLSVEDDLVDEYLSAELSPEERQQFEQKLLATPKQRERLHQAHIFHESVVSNRTRAKETKPAKTSSWFNIFRFRVPAIAAALALLLLTIGLAWLVVRERQLAATLQQLKSEREAMQQREQELRQKLTDQERMNSELREHLRNAPATEPSKQSPVTPTIATFVLSLTSSRGGSGASSFTLKPNIEIVQLLVPVTNAAYSSYRAELQTAEGTSLYKTANLKLRSNASTVSLTIPSKVFNVRDYVLKISGVGGNGQLEDAGFYSFRIVRD